MFRKACILFAVFIGATAIQAMAETHPGQQAFVDELTQQHDNLSAQDVNRLLDQAQKRDSIIRAITRPAESKTWPEYRAIFMTPDRIRNGAAFYRENRQLLAQMEKEYGVPAAYLVAILGVETSYGKITGTYKVLDALVTLAFYYPSRASFFRSELKELLTLPASKRAGPVDTLKGSYAGAQGWGQFMPSSIRAYAVDADDDGHIDMVGSLPDILASVANYFRAHGWQRGEPVAVRARAENTSDVIRASAYDKPQTTVAAIKRQGYSSREPVADDQMATLLTLETDTSPQHWLTFTNFYVITRYNHSAMYAMAVHQLAQAIQEAVQDSGDDTL